MARQTASKRVKRRKVGTSAPPRHRIHELLVKQETGQATRQATSTVQVNGQAGSTIRHDQEDRGFIEEHTLKPTYTSSTSSSSCSTPVSFQRESVNREDSRSPILFDASQSTLDFSSPKSPESESPSEVNGAECGMHLKERYRPASVDSVDSWDDFMLKAIDKSIELSQSTTASSKKDTDSKPFQEGVVRDASLSDSFEDWDDDFVAEVDSIIESTPTNSGSQQATGDSTGLATVHTSSRVNSQEFQPISLRGDTDLKTCKGLMQDSVLSDSFEDWDDEFIAEVDSAIESTPMSQSLGSSNPTTADDPRGSSEADALIVDSQSSESLNNSQPAEVVKMPGERKRDNISPVILQDFEDSVELLDSLYTSDGTNSENSSVTHSVCQSACVSPEAADHDESFVAGPETPLVDSTGTAILERRLLTDL